jgi:hypothetical protein
MQPLVIIASGYRSAAARDDSPASGMQPLLIMYVTEG